MLKVLDLNGDSQEVEVIRYFKMNGVSYLLYALNEVDEQDYLKLYGAKVSDGVGNNIEDAEWDTVKEEIKRIIKGNKEGNLQIEDLNFVEIDGLTINDFRAFKLSNELVSLLKANKKEFAMEVAAETNEAEVETPMPETSEPQFEPSIPEVSEPEMETPMPESYEPQPEVSTSFEVESEKPEGNPFDFPATEEAKFDFPAEEEKPAGGFDLGLEIEGNSEMPTSEDVASIEPTEVKSFDEPDINNYEAMYKEAQEVNVVLKDENEELKRKLGKITQLLNE